MILQMLMEKNVSYINMSHNIFLHKIPADFPVLNLKTKHSHHVSIDTDGLTITHLI